MGLAGGLAQAVFFGFLHVITFALALTVCGLYGKDLHKAHSVDKYSDPKWAFAVAVGGISAFTSVVYFFPFLIRFAAFFMAIWDIIQFILWIAVFAVFATLYLHEDPEGDSGIERMRHAMWIDLTNALLWLIIGFITFAVWWRQRREKSQFTGRARAHV